MSSFGRGGRDDGFPSVRPRPGAAATRIPSAEAAVKSKVSNCVPVASKSLRLGRARSRSPGKGVRSRIDEMMVKGFSRSMMACFSAALVCGWLKAGRLSWKAVTESWDGGI